MEVILQVEGLKIRTYGGNGVETFSKLLDMIFLEIRYTPVVTVLALGGDGQCRQVLDLNLCMGISDKIEVVTITLPF